MLKLTSVYSNYFKQPSIKEEEEEEETKEEEKEETKQQPFNPLLVPLPVQDPRIDTLSRLLVINTVLLVTLVVFRKWY
jgi:hypothetical protein